MRRAISRIHSTMKRSNRGYGYDISEDGRKAIKHAKRTMTRDDSIKSPAPIAETKSRRQQEFMQLLHDRNILGDSVIAEQRPELVEHARRALAQYLTKGSINAYTSAWRNFSKWCRRKMVDPIHSKESDLVLYVFEQATKIDKPLKYATLKNYLFRIGHYLAAGGKTISLLDEMPFSGPHDEASSS